MGDAFTKPASDGTNSTASAQVICEEFLKVLSRKEVEQPMICQNLCLCAQLWRYQHYLLPLWPWGVTKIVCLGLGSFRDTISNGGPFTPPATTTTTTTAAASFSSKHQHQPQPTYRDVIRNSTLLAQFNARLIARHDALQAMLRHVAAIEIASMLKFCSSKRGIEHQLVKYHFKKLAAIAELSGSGSKLGAGEEGKVGEVDEVGEKVRKKLGKMPPTAGYAGDKDLVDVGVYLWDSEYTDEDREALGRLERVFEMAHLPPVRVVDEGEVGGLVDEHALVYAVDSGVSVKSVLLGRSRPAAMVVNPESGSEILAMLDDYVEFKLEKRASPHTVGSSHLYIRKDIVEAAERNMIVPPYTVTFPHSYPYKHESWYLDGLQRNGSGKVIESSIGKE